MVQHRFNRFYERRNSMTIKAGVWLDHKQAIVVLLAGDGQEIKKIAASVEKPAGGKGSKSSYTRNDFVAEDTQERKAASRRQKYFDEVLACIREADAVLILGPGEAKGEFVKRLTSKKFRAGIVEQETADKMTQRQVAAKVSQHFANLAANEPNVPKPKKVTKKKAAKTASSRRPKR